MGFQWYVYLPDLIHKAFKAVLSRSHSCCH